MCLHTYRRYKTLCAWFTTWQELLCQWLYCLWLHVHDVVQDYNGFFHVYWSILKFGVHHQHVLCHADQTWLWQPSHFLSICFVIYVLIADQLLRLLISWWTSSVSFTCQMSDLCRNNKLYVMSAFFFSLFYYDAAYLWLVICQYTVIHYSEVLTVPQVNQIIKLCKNM